MRYDGCFTRQQYKGFKKRNVMDRTTLEMPERKRICSPATSYQDLQRPGVDMTLSLHGLTGYLRWCNSLISKEYTWQ